MVPRKLLIPVMLSLALLAGGCNKSATSTAGAPQPTTAVTASTGTAGDQPLAGASASTDASSCPTSNTTPFAKSKFLLHTGLAFGAFHRYLYKPFRAGTFTSGGAGHRVLVFAKAGAAALFIKREVRLSIEDVKASPILCKTLAAPLSSLSDTVGSAVSKLKSGDTSPLTDVNSQIATIEGQAGKAGTSITEDPNATIR